MSEVNTTADDYGRSKLFQAVQLHDLNLIKMLLSNQSDPNRTTIRGESCLHVAASEAVGFEVANLIQENKHNAVEERITIVKELLKYNAIPDCEDNTGFQPIHACILSSTAGSVSQLLTILKIFVEHGVDINTLDGTEKGFNVLHFACALLHSGEYSDKLDQNHVYDVVKVLYEEMNVDLLAKSKQNGMMGIHFSAERGHIMVIEYIIKQVQQQYPDKCKEDFLNIQDLNGNTMLHHASIKKRDNLIEWLKEQGSHIGIVNKNNLTPHELYVQKPSILYEIEKEVSNINEIK